MRHLLAQFRKEERGSVAILVALSLTVMLGVAALGTDVGMLFAQRHRLSAIADAAALSGAQFLPDDQTGAIATARLYLQKNNEDPNRAVVTIADDKRHVQVKIDKTVSLTFARFLGFPQQAVIGVATAWSTNLSGYFGAAPFGVPQSTWKLGQRVILKMGADPGGVAPGNYQALALGKSGASMYEQNIMVGYQDWIRVDDWVDTEPGDIAGPTVRGVNYRVSQDPNATYSTVSRLSPRVVVVPVLENFNVNGKGQVHVVGFAAFFLESANQTGSNAAQVTGRFLRMVMEGESSATAPDFGARVTKLSK